MTKPTDWHRNEAQPSPLEYHIRRSRPSGFRPARIFMLQTFAILLIFQSIGEVISYALHLPVPGPVIGMILLFGWLVFDDRLLPVIQPTTGELLKHLSLLFVPAGVGIMVHARRIEGEWLPIAPGAVDRWRSPPPRWSRAC